MSCPYQWSAEINFPGISNLPLSSYHLILQYWNNLKNITRIANAVRCPTGMAEIQNDQQIDLSEFVRETHVCLKNNDYNWRAETKQKHQEILCTLTSNV